MIICLPILATLAVILAQLSNEQHGADIAPPVFRVVVIICLVWLVYFAAVDHYENNRN